MARIVNLDEQYIPREAGETISFMGMELVWKITSRHSGGAFVVFIQVAPPGTGVPMHIHHREEENIYLLEGEMVFALEDPSNAFEVKAGDMVDMPKGMPHGFRVTGDQTARILFTLELSPESDYETMFAGLVGVDPADFDTVVEVCGRNEVEFLSPPQMP